MYGYGYGLGGTLLGGKDSYDPIAESYFTRAGITNVIEKNAVNNFVLSCRSNTNIWNAIVNGAVWLISPTSYGASLHNLMSSSFLMSTGVAPSFSTNGLSFNGVNQYIKTGFIPSANLTLYSHTTIFYNRTSTSQGATIPLILGAVNGNEQKIVMRTRNNSNGASCTFYNNSTAFTATNTNGSGYYDFSITANNARRIRKNSASLTTSAVAAVGTLPTVEFYIGTPNTLGAPTAGQYALCEIASLIQTTIGLSTSDADTLVSFLTTYNANVIPGGR
jgi:hypothetical protein